MLGPVIDLATLAADRFTAWRTMRRWRKLRELGMRIGDGVVLPASTWIDAPHCYLISIEDRCVFGEECLLLAHDAQMDEFLDAGRLGRVTIHTESNIGHRVTILPGVEVGPRTIVLPQSVVSRSLPPDTVCAGSPAKVVSSLPEYLDTQRKAQQDLPVIDPETWRSLTPSREGRARLAEILANGGYVPRVGSSLGGTKRWSA